MSDPTAIRTEKASHAAADPLSLPYMWGVAFCFVGGVGLVAFALSPNGGMFDRLAAMAGALVAFINAIWCWNRALDFAAPPFARPVPPLARRVPPFARPTSPSDEPEEDR